MADGALNLTLSDYTTAKLAERARTMGMEPEALAAMLLDGHLFNYDDFTWINGDPRDLNISGRSLHEDGRPWSEVRPQFTALIDETFGSGE